MRMMALYKNRERGFGGVAPESDRGGQQNASAFASGGPAVPPKAPRLFGFSALLQNKEEPMLQAILKYKILFAIAMIVSMGFLASGCTQKSKEKFRKKIKSVREVKRKAYMKKIGITEHMQGVNDSARIVYVAVINGKTQLHTIEPNGQNPKQITDTDGYKCRPSWNLPHTKIAFFQYPGDEPLGDKVSIEVISADGSNQRTVVANKKIKARRLRISWKPDSSVIYFQEMDFPTILYGYSVAEGKQVETLRLPKTSFMTEAHSLSPDMKFIAGAGPTKRDNVMHIGTVAVNGKMESDLMKPFEQMPYHIGTVVWNYDGHLIAFELDKIIMVMSKRFSIDFEIYPLSPQDFSAELSGPAFSPSTKYMACILEKTSEGQVGTGDQSVKSDVWIMNIDGTRQKQITYTGSCFDPHW
jgi:Tol biopolymer transport system component